eukprot:234405-Chlamydomonas_euryale.AAC.2
MPGQYNLDVSPELVWGGGVRRPRGAWGKVWGKVWAAGHPVSIVRVGGCGARCGARYGRRASRMTCPKRRDGLGVSPGLVWGDVGEGRCLWLMA